MRYKVEVGTIKGVGAINREAISRVGAVKEAEAIKEVEEAEAVNRVEAISRVGAIKEAEAIKEVEEAEAIREVEAEAIKEVEIYPVLLNQSLLDSSSTSILV